MAEVRRFLIGQALDSFSSLAEKINELTEAEVLEALNLEASTTRRRSMIDRLIGRAIRLRELDYQRQLKEKYHATSQESDDPRREKG